MTIDLTTDLTAATEGSRDLSDHVLLALGWRRDRGYVPSLNTGGDAVYYSIWRAPDDTVYRLNDQPNPTVNLQDAVDLVPADAWWVLNSGTRGAATALMPQFIEEIGNTPQLALCIALLKYMEKT